MEKIIEVYTESTPNPETIKFVTNQHLLPNYSVEFKTKEIAEESPLAQILFDIPFVVSVFIANNFITITKKENVDWYEISPEIKAVITKFLSSGQKAVSEKLYNIASSNNVSQEETTDPATKIKQLLDKYVKPAVENDGGNIAFVSFENGVVSLLMQGACSGCPSSQITLKNGIEGLLKRMVPEVVEVVAVAG